MLNSENALNAGKFTLSY